MALCHSLRGRESTLPRLLSQAAQGGCTEDTMKGSLSCDAFLVPYPVWQEAWSHVETYSVCDLGAFLVSTISTISSRIYDPCHPPHLSKEKHPRLTLYQSLGLWLPHSYFLFSTP